jgi:hypothetical protein
VSFLERIARRALDADDGVPQALPKDLPLRQAFVPPPPAPADVSATPPAGDVAVADAPPAPEPAAPAGGAPIARQVDTTAADEEDEQEVREASTPDVSTLRRQPPAKPPEPEEEAEENEARPLRRQTAAGAEAQPCPRLPRLRRRSSRLQAHRPPSSCGPRHPTGRRSRPLRRRARTW